jgi:hypothetical protein
MGGLLLQGSRILVPIGDGRISLRAGRHSLDFHSDSIADVTAALSTPSNLTARFRFSAYLIAEEACAPFQITAAS